MREGEVYITNDPWRGTGHLFDFTVVTPAFHRGALVAVFACTAHVADIGGNGADPTSRDVFAEGLFIPIMRLCERGEINRWLIELMRANSREPDALEGDVHALIASNERGASRLGLMLDEYGLADLEGLSAFILQTTEASMRRAIAALPQGSWSHAARIDGYDEPIDIVAKLTIADETISIDYAGTSPVSKFGVNCPICYTHAYTSFGVKCLIAPRLANNAAVLDRIRVTAPENCILNALPPHPVTARSVIGQMLPDVVFGCFDLARPGLAPAEGTGASWSLRLGGGRSAPPAHRGGATFMSQSFQSGGMGAHPLHDGLAATPFPSGVRAIAIEITEATTPLVFWRKELRMDSGGAGERRGGLGQTIEVASREAAPFVIFARYQRVAFPAQGRHGGSDGAAGALKLASGAPLGTRGTQVVPAGERLVVEMPGGGGLGAPLARDPDEVARDVVNGYVSSEAARDVYRVLVRPDGSVDEPTTVKLRAAASE
jgi:N-methylhydantoinase B